MKKRPLTLQSTIWLTLTLTLASTVLGAAALYGFQIYRIGHDAGRERIEAISSTYAVQLAGPTISQHQGTVQSALDHLMLRSDVIAISVLSATNQSLAARGDDALLASCRSMATSLPIEQTIAQSLPRQSSHLPDLQFAAVPIIPSGAEQPVGRLICIARASRQAAPLSDVTTFFTIIGLIAATGLVLSVYWLKHAVVTPLCQLTRARRVTDILATDRPDEIGEVARFIAELREHLDRTRYQATSLQRTMNDRVAAETQDISRELHRALRQGMTDPLTKLGNRQLFDDRFAALFQAQSQAGGELTVIMLDVDNFKTLNDTLGHQAGDELLTFVGELVRQGVREGDLAIRLGGDEFLIVLPGVTSDAAHAIAQRTILLFGQRSKLLNVSPVPTMSAGIASMTLHGADSPAELLEMADEALYEAKNAGKARAVVHRGYAAVSATA